MTLTIHIQGAMVPYAVGFPTIDLTVQQEGMGGLTVNTSRDNKVRATVHGFPENDNVLSFLHRFAQNIGEREWLFDLDASDPSEVLKHMMITYFQMLVQCVFEHVPLKPLGGLPQGVGSPQSVGSPDGVGLPDGVDVGLPDEEIPPVQ